MRRRLYLIIGLFFAFVLQTLGAKKAIICYDRQDSITVTRLLANGRAAADSLSSSGKLALFFARQLLDRPYVAHTLEGFPDQERLVVNTRQLDCTTLVETVMALTLCAKQGKISFADYCRVLQQVRYRQGKLDGYPSRLHYFSDWINDKTLMGLISEIQQDSEPFTAVQKLNINYMSTHPNAYVAFKKHPQMVTEIAAQERALTGRCYRYIPKSQVKNTKALRQAVHDGDIIAITCNKPGLDIAHVGYALWRKDGLHLLNASMIHKKVVIEPMTLGQYLSKHPSHTGIRVIRIKN